MSTGKVTHSLISKPQVWEWSHEWSITDSDGTSHDLTFSSNEDGYVDTDSVRGNKSPYSSDDIPAEVWEYLGELEFSTLTGKLK